MRKEHGEHNELLCEKLFKEGGFNDWVVTTAFYSSIHFVEHKLFPLTTTSGKVFTDLTNAHRSLRLGSPHATRKSLIAQYLPQLKAAYGFLDSTSRNARYVNYKISDAKASKCRSRLTLVKQHCLP